MVHVRTAWGGGRWKGWVYGRNILRQLRMPWTREAVSLEGGTGEPGGSLCLRNRADRDGSTAAANSPAPDDYLPIGSRTSICR